MNKEIRCAIAIDNFPSLACCVLLLAQQLDVTQPGSHIHEGKSSMTDVSFPVLSSPTVELMVDIFTLGPWDKSIFQVDHYLVRSPSRGGVPFLLALAGSNQSWPQSLTAAVH